MKKNLSSFLKLALSLGLGIGLIYWVVGSMSDEDKALTIDAFYRADYFWILAAPVLGLISNLSRAQRWRQLLEPAGHKPGYWNTFFSVMMMYFFNLLLPRLGEVTRCSVLARYENVPLDKSIGTMVVERIVDVVGIFAVLGIVLLFEYDRFANWSPHVDATMPLWAKLAVVVVVAVAVIGGGIYIEVKFGFAKLRAIVIERLLGFWDGLKSIKDVKRPIEFVVHTVFIYFCYWLMIYFSFAALPETAPLSALAGAACLFFGAFAMVATPGGIGAYPVVVAQVLVLYNISYSTGLAFGSIVWAAQTAAVLIGGAISLIMLAILNREPALDE